MNIPYIGEVSTGALIATLFVLILIQIWYLRPRLLKKKTREYASMFMVAVIAGLYLTNSLYIIGGKAYTATSGDQFTYEWRAFGKAPAEYETLVESKLYWIPWETWSSPAFQDNFVNAVTPERCVIGTNPFSFTNCVLSKSVSLGVITTQSVWVQKPYENKIRTSLPVTSSGYALSGVKESTKFALVEISTFGKGCSSGKCSILATYGTTNSIIVNPSTAEDECDFDTPCPSGQVCRIIGNGPNYCEKEKPLVDYCGDGDCNNGETESSCPTDCAGDPDPIDGAYCGDGNCDTDESCSTCESDCGKCGETCMAGYTGNYICDGTQSKKIFKDASCKLTYIDPETCPYGCDSATGRCKGSSPTPIPDPECTSLGGVTYNHTTQDCSEIANMLPATATSACCLTTPTEKGAFNWDILWIIFGLLIIVTLLGVVLKGTRKSRRRRASDLSWLDKTGGRILYDEAGGEILI